LLWSSGIVALGVALEGPEVVHEAREILFRVKVRARPWITLVSLIGWILVVGGVVGEGVSEALVSRADGNIQAFNNTRLADTVTKAGDAEDSAIQASSAANSAVDSARKASSLAGSARKEADASEREIASVRRQVGEAEASLSEARDKALSAEQRAQEAQSQLINLAICNAPRVIPEWSIDDRGNMVVGSTAQIGGLGKLRTSADPLRPMAGQKVFIQFVPDTEARRAALNLAGTLANAKWDVQPLQIVDGLRDGVSVQPSMAGTEPSKDGAPQGWSAHVHASESADKLIDFLQSYNWQATRGWPEGAPGKLLRDPNVLPADSIRVQIGLYPAVVYISPPGEKDLSLALAQSEQERQKIRKEMRERLLKQNPAMAKDIEGWDKQLDSEMERYSGPCRPLSGLPILH